MADDPMFTDRERIALRDLARKADELSALADTAPTLIHLVDEHMKYKWLREGLRAVAAYLIVLLGAWAALKDHLSSMIRRLVEYFTGGG